MSSRSNVVPLRKEQSYSQMSETEHISDDALNFFNKTVAYDILEEDRPIYDIISEYISGKKAKLISTLAYIDIVNAIATSEGTLTAAPATSEETEMNDSDWVKTLIDKIDQDRRDSEKRMNASVDRIERLIERQTDEMRQSNARIDQAWAHFQSMLNQTRWASVATVAAVVGIAIGVIVFVVEALQYIVPK